MPNSHRSQRDDSTERTSNTFYDQLKFALESLSQPRQLGQESPLAQPYFLGKLLGDQPNAATALGRGTVLSTALEQANAALWQGELPTDQSVLLDAALAAKEAQGFCDQYHYLLLDLTYFHRFFAPPAKQAEIYRDVLHVARATYDRHLREAIRRLGEILLLRLQPTLHVEQPLAQATLFGRDSLYHECMTSLQAKESVYLCGMSGIGKSALGAALAEQWSTPAVFWFTVRLTLNDQLTSLLFALGNFLHQQGASRLWLQLIANAGVMKDANLALELARTDLADLAAAPLLCFDEIDFLRPPDPESETVQHTQFLAFVDGLQHYAALLLMGQRPVLTCDAIHRLNQLSPAELTKWLQQAGVQSTPMAIERLNDYTGGNPRLIALALVLHRTLQAQQPTGQAATLDDVLAQLPQTPALDPIWQRLQQRLDPMESAVLQLLAVFRGTAPRDVWSAHGQRDPAGEKALHRLLQYGLVQADRLGGVAAVPALREIIYAQLTAEQREALHGRAGQIRAERGEYTAAAHHFYCAGQPEAAIAIWEPHQQQEVRRGQAAAALALFTQISGNRLSKATAQTLRLLRGQLYQLGGRSAEALNEVEAIAPDNDRAVDAAVVGGDALRTLGKSDAALAKYGEGLAAAARLLQRNTWLHAKRGTIHLQQRELDSARRETLHARYCLENLEGAVHETTGNYAVARQHYLNALAAAELLDDKVGLALVQRNLGVLAAHQADAEAAIAYHEQALAFYEAVGDRVNAAEVRSNLAGVYVQFEDFAAAIEPATRALKFFVARQNSYWCAQNMSNLATIYFELGDWTQAQEYAERTLEQEEPQSYPYALFTLGQIHSARQEGETALLYFERVRKIAEQSEDHFLLEQLEATLKTSGLQGEGEPEPHRESK